LPIFKKLTNVFKNYVIRFDEQLGESSEDDKFYLGFTAKKLLDFIYDSYMLKSRLYIKKQ